MVVEVPLACIAWGGFFRWVFFLGVVAASFWVGFFALATSGYI